MLDDPVLEDVDLEQLLRSAWAEGPRGLATLADVPDALRELAATFSAEQGDSGELPLDERYAMQLGSVGGGNHFAEIAKVGAIADKARACNLGLTADAQIVLVHSGSRALGSELAERYAGRELEGAEIDRYLADLRGAVRYARTNRLLVAWRLMPAAGMGSHARVGSVFDIVHNTVEARGDGTYLHRKGAAPAESGQHTVVLGSRGAPSYLMEGAGNEACLCCVAHGAGRRMGRSEAHEKLRLRHTRKSLERSPLGTRVICDDTVLMYEEHPDAYKPIEPVVESLE